MSTFLQKTAFQLHRLRQRKLTAWRAIRGSQIPLEPGLWLVGANFSRHWRTSKLPLSMQGAKPWGQWHSLLVRLVYGVASVVVPPWFAWTHSHPLDGEATFEMLLVGARQDVAAISASGAGVVRQVPASDVSRLVRLRQEIQKVYRCARFHLGERTHGETTALIFEELVEAPLFTRVSGDRQIAAVAQVLDSLASVEDVVVAESRRQEWSRRALTIAKGYMPSGLGAELGSAINDVARGCKVCWTHGDLHGRNVLVAGPDVVLIDFDRVGLRPAFFDPVTLIVDESNERGSLLLERYFQGYFDDRFLRLGVGPSRPASRLAAFSLWLGIREQDERMVGETVARIAELGWSNSGWGTGSMPKVRYEQSACRGAGGPPR